MGIFVEKNRKMLLFFAIYAAGLYLGFRYLLPLAAPFVLAFLAVFLVCPGLEKPARRLHIRREILFALVLAVWAVLTGLVCVFMIRWSANWLPGLGEGLYVLEEQLGQWMQDGCIVLENSLGIDAGQLEQIIVEKIGVFADKMQINIWPAAAKQSLNWLKKCGKAAAFWGITFVAAVLLCRDYDRMAAAKEKNQILKIVWEFAEKTVKMIAGYVKAQLVIIVVICVIAAAGLWMIRIKNAFLWGLLAGFLDALPFIGTGIVLLPLALWQLLSGRGWAAAAVCLLYVLCIAARELLEPRLLGKQLGISPVWMLFSVYAGVKVFGLAGLFLGPLYAMLLREGYRMYADNGGRS